MDRFVSNTTLRLDSKGRVSIPAAMRSVLVRDGFRPLQGRRVGVSREGRWQPTAAPHRVQCYCTHTQRPQGTGHTGSTWLRGGLGTSRGRSRHGHARLIDKGRRRR